MTIDEGTNVLLKRENFNIQSLTEIINTMNIIDNIVIKTEKLFKYKFNFDLLLLFDIRNDKNFLSSAIFIFHYWE